MKEFLEALGKTPYRILLLMPSMAFLAMAGYLVYKEKEPLLYVSLASIGALLFLLVRRQIKDEASSAFE